LLTAFAAAVLARTTRRRLHPTQPG
jgi:hypothetical protein